MRATEFIFEANPNQQLSRWHPETRSYKGSANTIPGSDTVDPDDITARRQRADSYSHQDLERYHPTDEPDLERKVQRAQLKRMFDRMLQDLPPRMKQFVYLRYHNDLTLAQVADRLGIALETARQVEAKMIRKLLGKHKDELRKATGAPAPAPTTVQISNKDAYAKGLADAQSGVKYNTENLLPRDKESYRLGFLAGYKK